MRPSRDKARYVMIGGFLGAGKTTAMTRLAEHLDRQGLKTGLISNDQSRGLADTALLRARGFRVEEITGGCFCCRFDSLMEATEKLSVTESPDVFLAEPVGSCTDLIATVSYPLRRLYGDRFTIAPLSVLVDPVRAARILGLRRGSAFSPKVTYVYLKQLEEAEIIVINKGDLIEAGERAALEDALGARFPAAEVLCCCARDGVGCESWFERVLAREHRDAPTMEVDYDTYAAGEAALGWLNATVRCVAGSPCDGNGLLVELAGALRERLQAAGVEIAHLKMTLAPDSGRAGIAAVNLVDSLSEPLVSARPVGLFSSGVLLINLRAEGDPRCLEDAVRTTLASTLEAPPATGATIELELDDLEAFRPSRPVPQHRVRR